MAAAHRLALEGKAPELADLLPSTRRPVESRSATSVDTQHAPSVDVEETWRALHDLIAHRAAELAPLVARPCQTNEVGRTAALAFGFFEAARTGLPLRLLEVGASAGLNLRFDQFRFGGGSAAWGPADSPVDLQGMWLDAPVLPDTLTVAERRGCDLRPVDPTSEDGRLALLASVWADQAPRFSRLRGAIEIARRVPAEVEAADVAAWLPTRLAVRAPGAATVVYHSIVDEYLPDATRAAFHAALHEAGAAATARAPLFWVRLEPFADQRTYGVTVTRWPGGTSDLLAYSGPHGSHVRLPASPR
jgi:hypothetical protein